jgi:hypothetical protein
MKKMAGKTNFAGSFAAISSAIWYLFVLNELE